MVKRARVWCIVAGEGAPDAYGLWRDLLATECLRAPHAQPPVRPGRRRMKAMKAGPRHHPLHLPEKPFPPRDFLFVGIFRLRKTDLLLHASLYQNQAPEASLFLKKGGIKSAFPSGCVL